MTRHVNNSWDEYLNDILAQWPEGKCPMSPVMINICKACYFSGAWATTELIADRATMRRFLALRDEIQRTIDAETICAIADVEAIHGSH